MMAAFLFIIYTPCFLCFFVTFLRRQPLILLQATFFDFADRRLRCSFRFFIDSDVFDVFMRLIFDSENPFRA